MPPLDLLIIALATWRAARLLTQEDGPFDSIAKFRTRYPLGGLMTCIYCMSIWVGSGAYLLWYYSVPHVLEIGAIAGAAMLLHRHTGGNHL